MSKKNNNNVTDSTAVISPMLGISEDFADALNALTEVVDIKVDAIIEQVEDLTMATIQMSEIVNKVNAEKKKETSKKVANQAETVKKKAITEATKLAAKLASNKPPDANEVLYQTAVHALGLAYEDTVQTLQNLNTIQQAAVTQGINMIYTLIPAELAIDDSKPSTGRGTKAR